MGIGENIARMRKEYGWTQEELARKMGYKSKSTINKIEMGINDIPQSKIVKFAEALHTTPAHLMGWDKRIEENPVETAKLHVDMITDPYMIEIYEKMKDMDEETKRKLLSYATFLADARD